MSLWIPQSHWERAWRLLVSGWLVFNLRGGDDTVRNWLKLVHKSPAFVKETGMTSCHSSCETQRKGSSVFWPAPEIFGTFLTREELWEKVDKLPHLLLLWCGRLVRVVRRHGVQEGPGVPAQLLPVQWALRILLLLRRCGLSFLENHTGQMGSVYFKKQTELQLMWSVMVWGTLILSSCQESVSQWSFPKQTAGVHCWHFWGGPMATMISYTPLKTKLIVLIKLANTTVLLRRT